MSNIDEKSKQDFLIYANSVIKSRAIPSAEDNLKPIHRRILWSMYENKYFDNKPTVKSAKVVGNVMGSYHPHGDSSIYEAVVRLSQWWKLRYPLVEMQGNCGNILGDGAAASRYTECKLSKIGMFMLEDINKNCISMRPNFDNSCEEPVTLPSKFPYLLCGNNSGIAVGMGSDLVSHNFTEVMNAIKFYIKNKDCSIADLMQYIKSPDFPTGGVITNGDELLNIYTTGSGSVKVKAHYDITKKGTKTLITFHDLPYGVDIDDGVKAPLKKLVLDDGYEVFEDIAVQKVGNHNFDITITLGKNANVAQCLDILFQKTKLSSTIKINNNLIINGEPKVLNLKQMIEYWVNYRSLCISKVALTDFQKTNHKLTVVLGLKKCMSDIDKLINLIRGSASRDAAKTAIKSAFELNDEQADAVLDMKLSRLSKIDLQELDTDEKELTDTLARIKNILDNEDTRYEMIINDLNEIKKVLGADERLTEVAYVRPVEQVNNIVAKREFLIYSDGLHMNDGSVMTIENNLVDAVFAYTSADIIAYSKDGTLSPISLASNVRGAMVKMAGKDKIVMVTANGQVKVSMASDYKLTKSDEKMMKLKEDDEIVCANFCNDADYVMIFDGNKNVLKLAIKDLTVASKMTVGTKCGFAHVLAATVVSDGDNLLFVTKTMKGKFTPVNDFSTDSKGNKGQMITDDTIIMKRFDPARENIYLIPKQGKAFAVDCGKISCKSRTAVGASISNRVIEKVL